MRIMVIDDEPFALKLLVRQLEDLGYPEVLAYENAHDALASVEEAASETGLIFCDLQMPGMDGVEFVRHLVQVGYMGGLVLVSGEDERIVQAAQKLARAYRLDVLGALHKPVLPEDLQRVLESDLLRVQTRGSGTTHTVYDAAALQRGIEQGELVNHYQPIVELASGRFVGVETLVRWQHPVDGLVYPDQFIGVAEDNGLIDALTLAVLGAAVRQSRRWQDSGLDLHVAVNVSMENLRSLQFPDLVVEQANHAGIALCNLILEVTESRLMKDVLAPLDILTRLRLKRIRLSIDDFGTGHSSLAQLRDLPFQELKVDRGFVHGADRDASLRAIVEANLGMARQLGMRTVAEGVEDRADWDYLRSAGCDMAQGYFIGKPMSAEKLAEWIPSWENRRSELTATLV